MKQLFLSLKGLNLLLIFCALSVNMGCRENSRQSVSEIQTISNGNVEDMGELRDRIIKSEQRLSSGEKDIESVGSDYYNVTKESFPNELDPKFWEEYVSYGMSENHGCYAGLYQYEGLCDPASVFESYFYAVKLWQKTRNSKYKDDAELIYYNAICHMQNSDGYWGYDNTPGNKIQDVCLKRTQHNSSFEKNLYCTTALNQISALSYFIDGTTLYVPFMRENKLTLSSRDKDLKIRQQTNYPFGDYTDITIEHNSLGIKNILIAAPDWTKNHKVFVNDEKLDPTIENGFININKRFKSGDKIKLTFSQSLRFSETLNKENTNLDQIKIYSGPLLLGYSGKEVIKLSALDKIASSSDNSFFIESKNIKIGPIYAHPKEKRVNENDKKQILF